MATKPLVSASAVPNYWDPSVTCREMTTEEVEFCIRKFGEGAAIARRAGFDGVEIHAVHEGYLLDQFTIAMFNHRTDKFGGDLNGRLTLPCEIVKTIKEYTSPDFPVCLRYSIKSCIKDWNQGGLEDEDYVEKGRDLEEGLEAARVLRLRGYDVSLYEASDQLGGNIIPGAVPDFKFDDRRLLDYYRNQMEILGIQVHMNTKVTADMVKEAKADVTIIAAGSTIKALPVPDPCGKVISAIDVLMSRKECGQKVVMSGGGLVGCETALWLAQMGKDVTVVEMLDDVLTSGKPVPHMNKIMLLDLMTQAGVKKITKSSVLSVNEEGAVLIDRNFRQTTIPADTVVAAIGFTANNQLFKELYGEVENLYNVGDSEVAANIMDAIWTANEVALNA